MKKFLRFLLVVFMVTFIGVIKVNAEDYKINVEVSGLGDVSSSLDMTIDGQFDFNNYKYYIWFLNENDPVPTPGEPDSSNNSIVGNWHFFDKCSNSDKGCIYVNDDWYMLDGYDYAYIEKREKFTDNYSLASSKIKIEKPKLLPNKKRYGFSNVGGLFDVFLNFPCKGNTGNHKLYTKVGKITDTSLIREYNDNKFDNLFSYARKDNSDKLGSCEVGKSSAICSPFKLSGIEVGSYYYVYIYMDDPLYRDLSAVFVAIGENGEPNYIHYLETADVGEEGSKFTGNVVSNPKTADLKITIIILLVLFSSLTLVLGIKKITKIVKK